ncbi:S-layer homology domain-containing protein [Lysinibacillus sp. FJAT-14222]|uniref:S-layer homology domain-containing protein n=1 Tax=Lysinibacillus sp. FJAT-14222 TaxID=1932366 RepID=UPI00096A8C0D|nr:S-layer homology domain-containing protein [Lysinibacillus sp. FJAT-14222]
MGTITKQKKWWKRSLGIMLSTMLVASSLSVGAVPEKVQAASNKVPGNVSNQPVLWLKANDGAVTDTDETITEWVDQTGTNNFTVYGTPKLTANGINFNPVVSISGNSGKLEQGAKTKFVGDKEITYADAYAVFNHPSGVIVGSITGGLNYGPAIFSKEGNTFYGAGNGANSTYTTINYPINVAQPGMANSDIGGSDHTVRFDGKYQTLTGKAAFTPLSITPIIGSTLSKNSGSNYMNFNGDIAEVIVYNASTAKDRAKIETYLAVKYGITLDNGEVDYVATNGNTVWAADSTYKNNIAGIGRDDAEGLYQKQSRSINEDTQVAIGSNELKETNALNKSELIDKQYLVWGDNGQTLAFDNHVGTTNKYHSNRVWKVQNSENVGEVQIAIPKSAMVENAELLLSDIDTDFTTAAEHPYVLSEMTLNGTVHYTTKVTLRDGQYFTFAAPAPELVGAMLEQIGTDGNRITLTFDQEVALTDLTNFTVTVDGKAVSPTFKVDPTDNKKLILTLPSGTDVTGKKIKVAYDGAGNLVGKNTLPVRPFIKDITSVDKSLLQTTVTEVTGLTSTDYTLKSWADLETALKDAQEVLGDPDTTQEEVDTALTALNNAKNALRIPEPTSVTLEQTVADGNKVTLTFDQEVALTDLTGFTVTVDGKAVTPTFIVDPSDNTKVILTLPAGTDITNKEVKVIYDGTGTLKGTNDAPVVDFTKVAEDPFSAALQITKPSTSTVNDSHPTFGGMVLVVDSITPPTVTVVLTDENGIEITGTATVNEKTGEWTFTPPSELLPLPNGTYTLKVTATDDTITATTEKTFTISTHVVVDTSKLEAKVNEANGLTAGNYTPESWLDYQTALDNAKLVLTNPIATQAEVDAALVALTKAQGKLITVPTQTPGLGSLTPSTGTLSPSFSSEVTNYTMNVDYVTSQLSITAIPLNPGAKVTMTANGQAVNIGDLFPLAVGENKVVITVTDATGTKQYVITVYRANDTSSGSGGGGSTWTPTPPTENTGSTTTKIKVELEIDGDNPMEKTTVEIERTKHANGEITDLVALTEANAKEAVEKAKQIGNNIARIVIPDIKDEVDKVMVEMPKQSIQTLRENGLSLEISTNNAHIAIPLSSMDGVNDNFYFRLVPVKKESERKAIEERAKVEKVVRETLQSNDVRVVARPMTIETNMPSRPVQLTLPLKGVKVPTGAAERQAFLEQFAVFIEQSDGKKKVVFPEVVTMAKGELGLRFTVDKFGTFTVIQFEKPTVGKHEAYIKGFSNGTFGPEKNVTRAQVATMIARILGYTDDQTVDYAPFKDIPSNHYAAGAIAFVKERGIMNGDMNGNFRASENITRAQMATVVANYKQLYIEESVTITFNDTKGHWAQWVIEANRTAGIINGREDGSFAPNEHLTRAQAVVMMNRMFERGPLNGVTTPSFPDVKAKHWAFKEIEEAAKSHAYFIDEDKNEQLSK